MTDQHEHFEAIPVVETTSVVANAGIVAEIAHLATVTQLQRPETFPTALARSLPKRQRIAQRNAHDATSQYLNEIGTVDLLTAEEEVELAKKIEAGVDAQSRLDDWHMTYEQASEEVQNAIDQAAAAKARFMEANLRLVVYMAKKRHLPQGVELLDVIQEGNLGLERAVNKFDWRKGFKFSTYATWWIRQAIGRYLEGRAGLIALPQDIGSKLSSELRSVDNDDEKLSPEFAELYKISTPASLNKKVGEDEDMDWLDGLQTDVLSPEQTVTLAEHSDGLAHLLSELDDMQRHIIAQKYGLLDGEKKTFRFISKELEISPERVRRTHNASMAKLRELAKIHGFEPL